MRGLRGEEGEMVRERLERVVLLVEQNTQVALSASRYGYVLEMGRIALEGEASALRENPPIKQAYLGL